MSSIKIARTALISAGLSADKANAFMDKLNATFGSAWGCSSSGITSGAMLILPKANFGAFLDYRPLAADVTIHIPAGSLAPPVVAPIPPLILPAEADYFENDDGTFSCAYCNHKPYKTESACNRHIVAKHADKLEA